MTVLGQPTQEADCLDEGILDAFDANAPRNQIVVPSGTVLAIYIDYVNFP